MLRVKFVPHSYYQTETDSSGNYSLPVRQGDTVIAYAHSFSNDYIAQFYNDKSTILTADRIPISQDVSNINFVLQHKPVYNNGISGTVTNKDSVGIHSIILAIRRGDYRKKLVFDSYRFDRQLFIYRYNPRAVYFIGNAARWIFTHLFQV